MFGKNSHRRSDGVRDNPSHIETLELRRVPLLPNGWSPGIVQPQANLPYFGEFIERVVESDEGTINPSLAMLARAVAVTRYLDRAALSLAGYGHRTPTDNGDDEVVERLATIASTAKMMFGHDPGLQDEPDTPESESAILKHVPLQPVEGIDLLAADDLESIECGRLTHLFDHAKSDIAAALDCLTRTVKYFGGEVDSGSVRYRVKDVDNEVLEKINDPSDIVYICVVIERIHEIGTITLPNKEVVEVRLRTSFLLPTIVNAHISREVAEKFAALDELYIERGDDWAAAALKVLGADTLVPILEECEEGIIPISSTAYAFNRAARRRHDEHFAQSA